MSTPNDTIPDAPAAEQSIDKQRAAARAGMVKDLADHLAHNQDFLGHLMSAMLNTPAFVVQLGRRYEQHKQMQAALYALPVALIPERKETTNIAVFRWPLNAPEGAGQVMYYIEQVTHDEKGEHVASWQPAPAEFEIMPNLAAAVKAAVEDGSFVPGSMMYVEFVCPEQPTDPDTTVEEASDVAAATAE